MRIAVLGCGSIGTRLMACLKDIGETGLLPYDPSPQVRESTQARTGLRCSSSLADLWRLAPDVALITSPSPFHISLAREAVAHRCDIFVEKPLSNSLDGIELLIDDLEDAKAISMVGCNMRFHRGPATIKNLVDSGRIGDVLAARLESGSYLPDWRPWLDYRQSVSAREDSGGGVLLECIHEIDLSLWLFGAGRVVGAAIKKADSLHLEVDGVAEVLVGHDSGVLSSIHLNFVQRNYHRAYQVIGTEGTITWSFEQPWIEVRGKRHERIPLEGTSDLNQMYRDELTHFLECVRSRRQTTCTARDGLAALDIALRARDFERLSVVAAARRRRGMATTAVVQARMASTRLPGKVLADIEGKTMLTRVLEQAKSASLIDRVIVATSDRQPDDAIESACGSVGVDCFRGSEEDVLDRYYQAAVSSEADVIVRLTADCPLLDPGVIDKAVSAFRGGAFDYVSNTVHRSYPDGLDVEVFSFEALERSWKESRWKSEREHVTSYIWKHPELFRIGSITNDQDQSNMRWTVDRREDLEFVRGVCRALAGRPVSLQAVLEIVARNESFAKVNSGISCNEGYRKSIMDDRRLLPEEAR